jgi:hypothetical protein
MMMMMIIVIITFSPFHLYVKPQEMNKGECGYLKAAEKDTWTSEGSSSLQKIA